MDLVPVEFGVLGAVVAHGPDGQSLALKGLRHRAVLARLLIAHGRLVPTSLLIDDLWPEPPTDPVGSIRTFVAALRRVLEPDRAPRTPATLLVTEADGYRLRTEAVDARHFETDLAAARFGPPSAALARLTNGLARWRGPAYADVADQPWARPEIARLTELRVQAIELAAAARIELDRPAEAVADLELVVGGHPVREESWRLLALALYRSRRQADALAVLRRAQTALADGHGLDPDSALQSLANEIRHQSGRLDRPDPAGQLWARATGSFDRVGDRVRLQSTVDLLRRLAVTGGSGLSIAAEQRLASIEAAEQSGDVELTARVIGGYDVPAIWARSDDPTQAAAVVAAAERTLVRLPVTADADRARLLATIALESRGVLAVRPLAAALEAEQLARRLGEPGLLAFALNGGFMQSFRQSGQADRRAALGAELVQLGAGHALPPYQILGELIGLQAQCARGDLAAADAHAAAADGLAERYDAPLVTVFTTWYQAFRLAVQGDSAASSAYARAVNSLTGAGMPGLSDGLPALADLGQRLLTDDEPDPDLDYGPYQPWVDPVLGRGGPTTLEPPADQLRDVRWCLTAAAAIRLGDKAVLHRARAALQDGVGELVGGSSGLVTLGPTARWLDRIDAALC